MEKKLETIVESLSSLTILEVKALVDTLKEKWGVSDAVAVAAAPAAGAAVEVEEQVSFEIHLAAAPANKLKAIQAVRKFKKSDADPDMSLTEAKSLVESAPCSLYTDLNKDQVEQVQAIFKEACVEITVK